MFLTLTGPDPICIPISQKKTKKQIELEEKLKAQAEAEASEAATRNANLTAVLGVGEPHEGGRILTRLQGNIFLLNILDLKRALRKVAVSEEKLNKACEDEEDKVGNKQV